MDDFSLYACFYNKIAQPKIEPILRTSVGPETAHDHLTSYIYASVELAFSFEIITHIALQPGSLVHSGT